MKASKSVYNALIDSGISFVAGVPCANLDNLIKLIENKEERKNKEKNNIQERNIQYVIATREEEAVGICGGAHLANKRTAILMQNSGLGNCINAIGSLCKIYDIPILFIISHRGELKEQIPAQIPIGKWTKKLLETVEIPYYCPKTPEEAYKYICLGSEYAETMGAPVAILLDAIYWEYDKY